MKKVLVSFISKKLKEDFSNLNKSKFEDKQLHESISKAIEDLRNDPMCGVKIPKKLWPKTYVKEYEITNLWKYDLPNAWRLIYTIESDEVSIINIILEWFDHKNYEKRFKY